MLLGSHAINMDAKGRMAIPTKVRDTLVSVCGGRIVVTANYQDKCLLVYPEDKWQELLPQIANLPNSKKDVRRMQRLMLGYATPLEMDGNGRVLLPPTLREYAGLEKKVMLVGQGKKFELWSEDAWFNWLDESEGGEGETEELERLSL